MSLNIKKVQLGFRNEQLETKSSEEGSQAEYYFRDDGSDFGGIVVETINNGVYLKKSMENGLELARIERGDIPYIDGLKLPIGMNIQLFRIRLDKDLNIISVSRSATETLETLVDSFYIKDDFSHDLKSEEYIIYISMDIGTRISNSDSSYIGEHITFENLYEYEIDNNGRENKFGCKPKDGLSNFSGHMYARVIHNTEKLYDDTFATETEILSINTLLELNKGLKGRLGNVIEARLKNIDTLYISEDLVIEQCIAETDLLALDVIKLVKKGTDSIDNPTGEFLGLSVEALIDSDSAKHKVWGSSTKYLPYLIKGNKGCIHSVKGIDSIKCICAVTNTMIDSVDENYLSILVPKGKLLDMKTKYIEKLNTDDDDRYMDFEPFDKEDVDNFFDNLANEGYKPMFKGLDELATPFAESGNFGRSLYHMGGYNTGIGGFGTMYGFDRGFKPMGGFGYVGGFGNGFGYPYGYDAKTLRKINKQLNKNRKNRF